jgi:2-oxoglutarate dehydrogenase E1 component
MKDDLPEAWLDALVGDFGANYAFVADLLRQYLKDPAEVDPSWRDHFAQLVGEIDRPTPTISEPSPPAIQPPAYEFEESAADTTQALVPARPTARTRELAPPAVLPGDIVTPVRGGALRLVENMEASLSVPTATSSRTVPARVLLENRRLLNKHRSSIGASKISLSHLVAWAILRALESFPRLNDAYDEVDGEPHRIQRDGVRLGLAVDVARGEAHGLLVPNIKNAQAMSFSEFLAAFDAAVDRARKGTVTPDDFMGTTITYTNPGMLGTTASTPRLMTGQGLIVASGAADYPSEYSAMSSRTLGALGISPVMTLACTYDHRIIGGAESGLLLARIEALIKGEDGFYARIFAELQASHRPVRWEVDTAPPFLGPVTAEEAVAKQAKVLQLIRAYRVRGHLAARFDPLSVPREWHPELDPATYGLTLWDLDREFLTNGLAGGERATLRDTLEILRETYCGSVGVEFMFIADPERQSWLRERMESARNKTELPAEDKRRVLERLIQAASFERFLHARYVGHKRFSLEGCESLIPMLGRLLGDAARGGVTEIVIGMAHRGRLNVLHHLIGKPLSQIFSEFEESHDPDATHGMGDVRYHLGARGVFHAKTGEPVTVSVAPNPSHLEYVGPVVLGMVRARQDVLDDAGRDRVAPVLIHGDAAFSGQGIVAETLNIGSLDGYTTGGTMHIVVNNQIGFTTLPRDARSSTYCTDVARMVQAPIFHVNADDPEACVSIVDLAIEYRQRFHRDVVIDLVGYRRYGHSETDDPSVTQPVLYDKIRESASVAEAYGERLIRDNALTREDVASSWSTQKARIESGEHGGETRFVAAVLRRSGEPPPPKSPAVLRDQIKRVLEALASVPPDFVAHAKLVPLLRRRAELLTSAEEVDWATAEALAFGVVLLDGCSVRLSGQDSRRGTFSQRHAVLHDARDGRTYVPLEKIAPGRTRFEAHDSSLSEAAILAFEFGYSVVDHCGLTIWEAQFGDFANAAQVVIDEFVSASEAKWGQPSSLVLFLPHGQEGQGPEHSSARLERFLDLCAEGNLTIAQPSTPASFFHLLLRQVHARNERPLVVFTPKSLLRHSRCVSPLPAFTEGAFVEVVDDVVEPARVRRIVLTSGKMFYDLQAERETGGVEDVALVRMEQLYPFPGDLLAGVLARYPMGAEMIWAQEEPRNMGAWSYVRDRFMDGEVPGSTRRELIYVGRPAAAAPAPGSQRLHLKEQEHLVRRIMARG